MTKLGKKYRTLRKQQDVTLKQAAAGICSVSNLSRWENGKIQLDFEVVIQLLNRIHIDTNEFLNYAKLVMQDHIPNDAMHAIETQNTDQMSQLVSIYLNLYWQNKSIYYLYVALILSNQYLLIANQNIFPLKAQIHLYNYLSKTTLWSFFNLSFFGNSVFLIESKRVYAISMQIINTFDFKEDDRALTGLITALGTLSDAIIALIMRNDLPDAQKLLAKLKTIDIPKYLDFFNLVFLFLEKIIQYVKSQDEQPVLQFINSALNLGMKKSANIFIDVFQKIKNQFN